MKPAPLYLSESVLVSRLHCVSEFGGVFGVAQGIHQDQRILLMVLNHVTHAAETLLSLFFFPQRVLFGGSDVSDRDVVHSTVVKHHQCVWLLRIYTRALPQQKRAILSGAYESVLCCFAVTPAGVPNLFIHSSFLFSIFR